MVRHSLFVDLELCTGCQACEIACKQENNLPVGPRWLRVIEVGPREVGGKLLLSFVPMRCRHCAQPTCIDACPQKAISQRLDGIVLINPELCNGCLACIEACPFGAPQFNPEKNIVEKCTLCVHRIEQGLEPSCVKHCPAGAIRFGDINKLSEMVRIKQARNLAFPVPDELS